MNRDGRKLKGIKATLYYYFEILGNDTVNVVLLSKIVNEHYEAAKAYLEKAKRIQEYNAKIDIKAGSISYKVSDRRKGVRKPQRRIEDL